MYLKGLNELKEGDVVARPVWDDQGQILLHDGVVLQKNYIVALAEKGFTQIYVNDPETVVSVEPDEDLSPATRARALKSVRETFEAISGVKRDQAHFSSRQDIEKSFDSRSVKILLGDKGPVGKLRGLVTTILDEVLTRATLAGLTSLKSANGKLYEHSLDVCCVSILVGRSVGMTSIRLMQLATGCLLHDIGMAFVDEDADVKTRTYQHARLGYELLKESPDPDILAPHVAYEHHERQDGKGLPRGLFGSNTIERNRALQGPVPTLIGEIAAVANMYDNLLTGVDGRAALPPDMAIAAITKAAGTLLNREVVNAFLRVVPVYAKGMEVVMLTEPYRNFRAIVTKVNISKLDRPVIMVTRTGTGKAISPFAIDLSGDETMRVRSVRL